MFEKLLISSSGGVGSNYNDIGIIGNAAPRVMGYGGLLVVALVAAKLILIG